VSVPMTLSDLERRDAKDPIFPADLRKNAQRPNLARQHWREGCCVSRGQPRPLRREGGTPASSQCFGTSKIRRHDI